MGKNSRNNVSKMFKQELKSSADTISTKCFMTYPQINHKQKLEISFIKSLKPAIHISTPLIVLINFYI